MKKGLYALSFGTFGLGIAEYIMMSILPDVAADFGVSLPETGHLISAYALGVCVGAPLLVIVTRNWPLKTILYALMTLFIVGNLVTTLSPNYWLTLCARFVSGMPHGAYFGTGVIIANHLAEKGKSTSAVATMVMGMTVANLMGVPLGNLLGHYLSWRVVFAFATVWGLVTVWFICRWIPVLPAMPKTNMKGQFRFLKKPQPWLLAAATVLGNGGIFCWYSYINPMLTEVSGFSAESITSLMVLAGFGMVVGNLVSGRLSDRYTPGRVGTFVQGGICIILLLIFFLSPYPWCSALLMALCTTALFAVSSPEQVLIIRVAPGGEMLGGACVQIAFNLGNAIGAYVGGLATGYGYQYPALFGVPFALVGFTLFFIFYKKYQAKY